MIRLRNFIFDLGLFPISLLWEFAYKMRRFFYQFHFFKRDTFQVPIISVGNLTFGGTGKTPFTLWLSQYFDSMGLRVMVLMRGYKGKLENGHGILRTSKKMAGGPIQFGDEAMMLFKRMENASVVVGKKRSQNLEYYYDQERADVVILDDGHQHLKLERDLNIVLFDSIMDIERYKVAPRGYLREGLTALSSSDIVVLSRCDLASDEQKEKLKQMIRSYTPPSVPIVETFYAGHCLKNSMLKKVFEPYELQGRKVILIAGVASPDSFFKGIESYGAIIVHCESFSDHHEYKIDEIQRVLSMADKHDALIVTTEKDIVKIRRLSHHSRIVYLEIDLKFMSGEKELKKCISRVLLS